MLPEQSPADAHDEESQVSEDTQPTSDDTSPSSGEKDGLAEDMFSAVEGAVEPKYEEDEGDEPTSDEDKGDDTVPDEEASASDEQTPEEDGTPDDEAEAEEGDQEGDDEDDGELGELTEQELNSYRPRTQKRIQQLLAQRNAAQQQAEAVRPIMDFMQRNDIPQQDVDVILGMAARLRHGDFRGFLEAVTPYVQLAQQYTGQQLPQDLDQQVQQGYVSREVAQELASRRMREQWQQQEMQRTQQTQQQELVRQNGLRIRDAVNQHEQRLRTQDPDYRRKADIVRRTAQALIQENGPPQSPEQAIQYVDMAYEEANRVVKSFSPKKEPTSPRPSSVHQGSNKVSAEPSSMLEAAEMALRK